MKTLDLGCGVHPLAHDVDGVDKYDFAQKFIFDLNKGLPPEIANESYDLILAHNVLEHLKPEAELLIMNECWRVLRPKGILHIIVPKFGTTSAIADPTHLNTNWCLRKFTEYYAGAKPRNAVYYDAKGIIMHKWAIASKNGHYTLTETAKSIDIKLVK